MEDATFEHVGAIADYKSQIANAVLRAESDRPFERKSKRQTNDTSNPGRKLKYL